MDKLFFDLRPTHNPHRWYLPLDASVCVGPPDAPFMFGGVGLASAVAAMERTCGRPLVWATAHYLSFARPPSVVDLDVWTPVEGKNITQARVVSHVGDQEIITVNAALGGRPSDISQQWASMPDVTPPEDSEAAPGHWRNADQGVHSRTEVRLAQFHSGAPPPGSGRRTIWIRPREGMRIDAPMLAIFADYVPSGVGAAIGQNAGGNSLDNTLRIRRIVPTDWVLCDIQITGVHGGFAHGNMNLFSQDGELMATASQSLIIRVRERPEDR